MKITSAYESGVLTEEREGAVLPPQELWQQRKGGLVIVECPQRIPCNPCNTSCPTGAILPFADINDVPRIDYDKCSGCGICVAKCPGLACFVADISYRDGSAVIKLPYEMLPLPEIGEEVDCLGRCGETLCRGVVKAVSEPQRDRTKVVSVTLPAERVCDVRAIRVVRQDG